MDKFRDRWERAYPFALGSLAFVGWIAFGHEFAEYCGLKQWAFEKIFESIFGFLSITTGFLAGFYGTIQSITDGFIQEIRGSITYHTFLRYTKHGIIFGFIAAIYTIPFIVVQPLPYEQRSFANFMVGTWVGLSVTTLAMFWRVAQHLFSLFETRVNRPNPGG